MLRSLAVAACILVGSVALAAPGQGQGWTIKIPDGWQDMTAEAEQFPQIIAMKKTAAEQHGAITISMYRNDNGDNVSILYLTMPSSLPSQLELDMFQKGARTSFSDKANELSFVDEKTDVMSIATQKVKADGHSMVGKRWVGFQGETMTSVAVTCTGEAPICDPLMASVIVSPAGFRALSSLEQAGSGSWSAYRIGQLVGGAFVVLLFVAFAMRKKKSPANG